MKTRDRSERNEASATVEESRSATKRLAAAVDRAVENARNRGAASTADIGRQQQNLQDFAQRNPAMRHASQAERDELRRTIDAFAEQQTRHVERRGAGVDRIAGQLETAARLLAAHQQEERDRQAAPPADLAARHREQSEAMAALAETVHDSLTHLTRRDEERLRAQRAHVGVAVAEGQPADARRALQETADRRNDADVLLARDLRALTGHVTRAARDILERPNQAELASLREALGPTAAALDDEALARVHLAAARQRDTTDVANTVKGQLVEELLAASDQLATIRTTIEESMRARGIDAQLEFIAGDRIRDARNQKLTDGMLAWRDDAQRLRIELAFEAKAGEMSGEKLSRLTDTMSGRLMQETERATRDLGVTMADLLAGDVQAEAGQTTRTSERLTTSADHDTRIYVDGREALLARDQLRARTQGITPAGVAAQAHWRLEATAQEIEEATRAVVEREIERRRQAEI